MGQGLPFPFRPLYPPIAGANKLAQILWTAVKAAEEQGFGQGTLYRHTWRKAKQTRTDVNSLDGAPYIAKPKMAMMHRTLVAQERMLGEC